MTNQTLFELAAQKAGGKYLGWQEGVNLGYSNMATGYAFDVGGRKVVADQAGVLHFDATYQTQANKLLDQYMVAAVYKEAEVMGAEVMETVDQMGNIVLTLQGGGAY